MKSKLLPLLSLFALIAIVGCNNNKNPQKYLGKVLKNLEQIESIVYYATAETWNPGDTVVAFTYCKYIKEYQNPADTIIGTSVINLNCEDTTKIEFGYDGEIRLIPYHEHNGIVIDDFSNSQFPYRYVHSPFFRHAVNLIDYALNTTDSLTIDYEDMGDKHFYRFTIHEDTQIEFFGKARRMPENPYLYGETTSIYEMWIDKANNLPSKIRREMAHNISAVTCTKIVSINEGSIKDLNLQAYIPAHYETRKYGEKKETPPEIHHLIGKKAPNWILDDANDNKVSFTDFTSKALIINFTGIGCGPCVVAIPFLKELQDELGAENLQVAAIETWSRKARTHKLYIEKHSITYPFLIATSEIMDSYKPGSAVPVFFILDKN